MCRITHELTDVMTKQNSNANKLSAKNATINRKMEFGNIQQHNNTQQTSRISQIRLVDKSTNAWKLQSILTQINRIEYFW